MDIFRAGSVTAGIADDKQLKTDEGFSGAWAKTTAGDVDDG